MSFVGQSPDGRDQACATIFMDYVIFMDGKTCTRYGTSDGNVHMGGHVCYNLKALVTADGKIGLAFKMVHIRTFPSSLIIRKVRILFIGDRQTDC